MFMARTTLDPDLPSNTVDLPMSDHPTLMPGANREDAVVVHVTRDGRIFLRNERISLEELPDKIRKLVLHGAERKVYIEADIRSRYGSVNDVLERARAAGIENVSFVTQENPHQR